MEWTSPCVHNETLQCTISDSLSSEIQFLNLTQFVIQLSADLDNLPNSIFRLYVPAFSNLPNCSKFYYKLGIVNHFGSRGYHDAEQKVKHACAYDF